MVEKHLGFVLKTVERCNLNCNYCYFFNGLDKSFKLRPKFISRSTIDNLIYFISQGIKELSITSLSIGLHGGEPMMQPKEDFIYLIEKLSSVIPKENINFSIQTNATLVTSKWIDLFNKYDIHVGVSIDGPKEYHDKYRVDHYGNPSHQLVEKGIKLLQKKLKNPPGALVVINPEFNGKEIYRYLINLGIKQIDFLLPDNNYKIKPSYSINKYSKYLLEVFNEWIQDDNLKVSIKKFKSMMLQLLGKQPLIYGFGKNQNNHNIPLLSVRSDGAIGPTDELMSTDPDTVTLINKNVATATLQDVINHNIFKEIKLANQVAPLKCSQCCWYNACGGGDLVSRFSTSNRFSNPSIYCEAFEELYSCISTYLIKTGVPEKVITDNLFKQTA